MAGRVGIGLWIVIKMMELEMFSLESLSLPCISSPWAQESDVKHPFLFPLSLASVALIEAKKNSNKPEKLFCKISTGYLQTTPVTIKSSKQGNGMFFLLRSSLFQLNSSWTCHRRASFLSKPRVPDVSSGLMSLIESGYRYYTSLVTR